MPLDLSLRGIENGVRLMVPFALLIILFLLSVTAIPLPRIGPVKPALLLIAIYYWSIYRPTLTPPALCFSAGLLLDVMTSLPLGVNAVVLTLVQWVVRDQRKFLMGQAYITIWGVFALVAFLSGFIQWGLYGLKDMAWAPTTPVLVSVAATIFLFPVVTPLLILVHRLLPAAPKSSYVG